MATTPMWLAQTDSWHGGGMFIGMHWLWWLFWIGTLAVILWAVARASADRSESHRSTLERQAAEDTLRQRFAAGEIDEEEYRRRMQVLREIPPTD
jgi:putative membrane protein